MKVMDNTSEAEITRQVTQEAKQRIAGRYSGRLADGRKWTVRIEDPDDIDLKVGLSITWDEDE